MFARFRSTWMFSVGISVSGIVQSLCPKNVEIRRCQKFVCYSAWSKCSFSSSENWYRETYEYLYFCNSWKLALSGGRLAFEFRIGLRYRGSGDFVWPSGERIRQILTFTSCRSTVVVALRTDPSRFTRTTRKELHARIVIPARVEFRSEIPSFRGVATRRIASRRRVGWPTMRDEAIEAIAYGFV